MGPACRRTPVASCSRLLQQRGRIVSSPLLILTSPCGTACRPAVPQKLIDKLDGDLAYALRTDGKMSPEDCENYEEVGRA